MKGGIIKKLLTALFTTVLVLGFSTMVSTTLLPSTCSANFIWLGDWRTSEVGEAGLVGPQACALAEVEFSSPGDFTDLASIRFERDFQLSDSPQGWYVSVNGVLDYFLATDPPAQNVGPNSSFFSRVSAGARVASSGINTGLIEPSCSGIDFLETATVSRTSVGVLADGTYTVIGLLTARATAHVERGSLILPPTGTVIASADPFNMDGGFLVTLDAKAVPIPPTCLLFLSCLIMVGIKKKINA